MSTPSAELLFAEKDAVPISTDAATLKSWDHARSTLASAPKVWLGTTRPDRRPHAAPVLLVWADGAPHFTTRPASRKARNLASVANCVLTVAADDLDLVVEGAATRVEATAELAEAFKAKYGWALAVRDGAAFEDNLPGSPEYAFYRVDPARAFGYGADGLTATRWSFA